MPIRDSRRRNEQILPLRTHSATGKQTSSCGQMLSLPILRGP